jgi:molybdopterin synthase sulfur carrier subunit
MIRVLYFARLREQLETAAEELPAGPGTATIGAIADLLQRRGGSWAEVFGGDQMVLMSLNQEVADRDTPVADGDEVAFFPPVTGG